MEFNDIKIGDVVECGTNAYGGRGVVMSKKSGRIKLLSADAKWYDVTADGCDHVIKHVKIKEILEAVIM